MKENIPDQIMISLKKWKSQSAILQFFYIFLGGIAIISPLVVSIFTENLGEMWTRIISLCGAIAVGIIGGFRLSSQANKMRRAYLDLQAATVKYQASNEATLKTLLDKYISLCNSIGLISGPDADNSSSAFDDK